MSARIISAAVRYGAAKRLLRSNPLVLVKYYNNYGRSKTLKVFWWLDDAQSKTAVQELHTQLSELADYTSRGERGGDIYGFHVTDKRMLRKERERKARYAAKRRAK